MKNILPTGAILIGVLVLVLMFIPSQNPTPRQDYVVETQPIQVQPEPEPRPQPHPHRQPVTNYQKALAAAKKENKLIFLRFKADWCGPCKRMEMDTFSKPAVQRALQTMIVYVVDCDKEKQLVTKYQVDTIPAYVVINGSEQVIKSGKGYKGEVAFLTWLNIRTLKKLN